jgi:hypothetical protein
MSFIEQELIPDPEILINGLRDTGYEFNTALADVIDNSVDANATNIDVRILLRPGNDVSVMVIDDGCGMNKEALLNGMKYGSNSQKRDPRRLGKFGLGLKTASTAFCKKLSVISKEKPEDPLYMATWDLDFVAQQNRWILQITDEAAIPESYKKIFSSVAEAGRGTLVVWDKVDRLTLNKNSHAKLEKSLRDHLSMIFHRYLDHSFLEAQNISMKLNGKPVGAWDPFSKDHPSTFKNAEEDKEVEIIEDSEETRKAQFHLCAYTLPHKDDFDDDGKQARITNSNMGFFVYRENRMISYADWLGLRQKDFHDSLSRIEFSFDHKLDSAFKIDIKKSQITLNPDLADWIRKWTGPHVAYANDRYRRKQVDIVVESAPEAHKKSDSRIQKNEKDNLGSKITPVSQVDPTTRTQDVELENTNTADKPLRIKIIVPDDKISGKTVFPDDERFEGEVLWEPTWKDGHHAVRINVNHPYYQKVYVPNHRDGVVIDGLDSLLWALAEAENTAKYNQQTADLFVDLRIDVSRKLKRLVNDLPDPDEV